MTSGTVLAGSWRAAVDVRITRVLVVAGLLLGPNGGHLRDGADGESSGDESRTVLDVPAPWFWDDVAEQRGGGRAHRFELDDPSRTADMSAWYHLAYIAGGDRLTVRDHTAPAAAGPDTLIARAQNVAWHAAQGLLGRDAGVAHPHEIPDWAIARTGNNDGISGGLLFALAHLDLQTPGPFAGEVRVAATGAISSDGRITPVRHVALKVAAARLTGPDVVFAPSFPARSGAVTVLAHRSAMPGGTIGDWLRTDDYERAGREAAATPGTIELVAVDDIRQALAWLCGRAATRATCDLAHRAGSEPLADARPQSIAEAPTVGPH